jgi:hypothetical protein
LSNHPIGLRSRNTGENLSEIFAGVFHGCLAPRSVHHLGLVRHAALYDDCDDFQTPHVYPAGTGLTEDAECVHMVVNEGDTDLEIVVVQIVPLDAPRRIDEPAPEPQL